jgi:serine/threonine protein kinase
LQLEDFEKVRVLGVGGTGIVYELLHKTNGSRFAMKEMEIKNKTQMKMAVSEAVMLKDIMENVSHPNIMHIERVFQVGSKFYMVFPLCTGGELYEHIIKRGHFTEHDAAQITYDLVSGLHALHEHEILHLDIKPENILFDSNDDDAKIKITDFGLSKVFSSEDQQQQNSNFSMKVMEEKLAAFLECGETYKEQLRGTIGYMSPELILTGHCSKATDVFAAGVVLYILLCGRPPFNSKSNREVLERTARGIYKISGGEWDAISSDAKDLVQRMLTTNPLERITTAQILQHPWLRQLEDDEVGELGINISVSHLLGATNGIDVNTDTSFTKKLSRSNNSVNRKRSGVNLAGTLRQLSGHVKQRRSEKMATNLSRIFSSLVQQQEAGMNRSTLASQYLIPVEGANSGNSGSGSSIAPPLHKRGISDSAETDHDLLVLNSDFRAAMVAALSGLDELDEGRLTIEQFAAIMTQLIGVSSVSVTTLLMGRYTRP